MKDLKGRTAIVTGASRGIGPYIARALAKEGANLVLAARSAEALARVAEEIKNDYGVRTLAAPTDVTDAEARRALVARAEEFGGVDILVNNAGIGHIGAFGEQERDAIASALAIDLEAPILLTHEALPGMRERGRGHVVNIATIMAKVDAKYAVPYAAAKAGLIAFSRSLRFELRGTGVSASAVSPGGVDEVGLFNDAMGRAGVRPPRTFPLVTPEAVARGVVRAIKRDKAEVLVGPPGSKLLTLSPGFAARMFGAMGTWEMMRKMGEHEARTDTGDGKPGSAGGEERRAA